jgi:hypothetical protein
MSPSLNGVMPNTPVPRAGSTRPTPQRVQPQWAVHRTDSATHDRVMAQSPRPAHTPQPEIWVTGEGSRSTTPAPPLSSMGPPLIPSFADGNGNLSMDGTMNGTELGPTQLPSRQQRPAHEPLFLPSSQDDFPPPMSQLQLEAEAELVGMSEADLDALVADDDEDFGFQPDGSFAVLSSQKDTERELISVTAMGSYAGRLIHATSVGQDPDFEELVDDEMLAPTQSSQGQDDSGKVKFHHHHSIHSTGY